MPEIAFGDGELRFSVDDAFAAWRLDGWRWGRFARSGFSDEAGQVADLSGEGIAVLGERLERFPGFLRLVALVEADRNHQQNQQGNRGLMDFHNRGKRGFARPLAWRRRVSGELRDKGPAADAEWPV